MTTEMPEKEYIDKRIAKLEETAGYLLQQIAEFQLATSAFEGTQETTPQFPYANFPLPVLPPFPPLMPIPSPTAPGQIPGTALTHCQSFRVWRNRTGAPENRTVEVKPAKPPNEFPAGATVTVFVAPEGHNGGPPAAPAGGPPWPTLNPQGEAVAQNVPNGSAVFVHYGKGRRDPAGIRVFIDQSP